MSDIIVSNQAKCLICGDEPYSANRHDFKFCSCGKIAVDGGTDYLRRVGNPLDYRDKSIIMETSLIDAMLKAMEEAPANKNDRGILYTILRTIRDEGYSIKKT